MAKQTRHIASTGLGFALVTLLVACASTRNVAVPPGPTKPLSDEQQRKYDYFFAEAVKNQALGKVGEAFELYRHSLDINPNAASALYNIAPFYTDNKLGEKEDELESVRKAVANAPNNYWYNEALAHLYLENNKVDEAIGLLEEMAIRFPNKPASLYGLYDLYAAKRDYPNAILTLNRLEQKQGKTEQLCMEKFKIYMQMEDEEKAFGEINALVEAYPLDMRYRVMQGDAYLRYGKKDEAKALYDSVLKKEPRNTLAQISLATYYDAIGDKDKYYQQIDTILLNKDATPELKLNLMRQYIVGDGKSRKDSVQIISLFDGIMREDPDDTQIPMLYTTYLLEHKMDDWAAGVLNHILNLDPANQVARLYLLQLVSRKNNADEVIRVCKTGTEVTPEIIEFHFYLGIGYFQKERIDEAYQAFQEALKHVTKGTSNTMVSDIYAMMGDINHTRNLYEQAYADYDSALVYNPDNIGALNNYAYYLSVQRKNLDKAEEMSYKTVKAEPQNATYLDTYAWILFEKADYVQAKLFIDDALKSDGKESDVILDHAGDIYYRSGDVEGAVRLWKEAKAAGRKSTVLDRKIRTKKYIPEPQ